MSCLGMCGPWSWLACERSHSGWVARNPWRGATLSGWRKHLVLRRVRGYGFRGKRWKLKLNRLSSHQIRW